MDHQNTEIDGSADQTKPTMDKEENESMQFQLLGGFILLTEHQLEKSTTNELVKSLFKENAAATRPIYVSREGPKLLRLVFANNDTRELAVRNGLKISSCVFKVDPPKPPRREKTIYIYNIPLFESHENVANFLQGKGLKLKSAMRWLTYPDTDIRNGGRSIVVEVDDKTEIPGFTMYMSPTCKKMKKIAIWYPKMPTYCKSCFAKGHSSAECPQLQQVPATMDDHSYVAALTRNKKPPGMQNIESELSEDEAHLESLTTQKKKQPPHPVNNELPEMPNPTDNFVPFFTKIDTYSNFFPCQFEIAGRKYNSVEQFLFAEKARHQGDEISEARIMNNREARIAKQIGEKIEWEDRKAWKEFAKQKLKEGNMAKYIQNEHLRQQLFDTSPKVFVEASPNDTYWGVGLSKTNKDIQCQEKWKGKNVMGFLLTELRDEMMKDAQFSSNVEEAQSKSSSKRKTDQLSPDLIQKRINT